MKRQFMMSKIVASGLVALMIAQSATPVVAWAHQPSDGSAIELSASDGVTLSRISNNQLSINDESSETVIKVTEAVNGRTVAVTDKGTGETNSFVFNKESGTVFSTYTGKTVDVRDIVEVEEDALLRSRSTYSTIRISYAKMKELTGGVAAAGAIAGAILAFVPGGAFIAKVADIVAAVSAGMSMALPQMRSHGIFIRIKTTKFYRRGNKIPWRTTKEIVGLGTY